MLLHLGIFRILVVDSIDVLAKEDRKFLGYLQDFAKKCADCGYLRLVFVSSDGTALPLLMARSSWSRARSPPFEIGEISDEEAVEFLKGLGVPVNVGSESVRVLTGGEFSALNNFADCFRTDGTLETLKKLVHIADTRLQATLLKQAFDFNHNFFYQLMLTKRMEYPAALKLGMSAAQIDQLLKYNVLAIHPDEQLTFYNRHTQVWFEKQLTFSQ